MVSDDVRAVFRTCFIDLHVPRLVSDGFSYRGTCLTGLTSACRKTICIRGLEIAVCQGLKVFL